MTQNIPVFPKKTFPSKTLEKGGKPCSPAAQRTTHSAGKKNVRGGRAGRERRPRARERGGSRARARGQETPAEGGRGEKEGPAVEPSARYAAEGKASPWRAVPRAASSRALYARLLLFPPTFQFPKYSRGIFRP